MPKNEQAILDFGSQKLSLLVGNRDVNNSLNVRCIYEEKYEGFLDGEFLEPKNLVKNILNALQGAEKVIGREIKSLTIGVPTEFCYSTCVTTSTSFDKQRKINFNDIKNIFDKAAIQSKTHTIINKSAVYYILGENNKVQNPISQVANKITAYLSLILCDNSFISTVSKAMIRVGIDDFTFTSSALCQAQYLFSIEERDKYVLFVDCGYITTTVALVRGDGLLNMSSFSLGGGHIIADLSQCLKLPFNVSEQLFKKVVLCIEPEENDTYDIIYNKEVHRISINVANAIVESRIENIAKAIQKCLSSWEFNFPDFICVNLTGGGISFTRGGAELLSKYLDKNVKIVELPYSQLTRTNYSSCLAVLNYALNNN